MPEVHVQEQSCDKTYTDDQKAQLVEELRKKIEGEALNDIVM